MAKWKFYLASRGYRACVSLPLFPVPSGRPGGGPECCGRVADACAEVARRGLSELDSTWSFASSRSACARIDRLRKGLFSTFSNTAWKFPTTRSQKPARIEQHKTDPAIMVAATRRQRARVAHNTGEQALLVLRKTDWMSTPDDARSEAVCRAAALADDTDS